MWRTGADGADGASATAAGVVGASLVAGVLGYIGGDGGGCQRVGSLMWPFKRKPEAPKPLPPPVADWAREEFLRGYGNHILGPRKTMMTYLEARQKRRNKMTKSMPVEYRIEHSPDGNCKREVVVPEGWERCKPTDIGAHCRSIQCDVEVWTEHKGYHLGCNVFIRPIRPAVELVVGAWYETPHGVFKAEEAGTRHTVRIGGHLYSTDGKYAEHGRYAPRIIRRVYVAPYNTLGDSLLAQLQRNAEKVAAEAKPSYDTADAATADRIKRNCMIFGNEQGRAHCCEHGAVPCPECAKPFRLSGPGWHKIDGGHWLKVTDHMLGYWRRDGSGKPPAPWGNLIARASEAHARVLDSL